MKHLLLIISLVFASAFSFAQEKAYKTYPGKKIHYSAFNSSFVAPDVASIYNISRGKDKGLVNIAVVPDGSEYGVTAAVSGTVNNLIAQQQNLDFIEVREGDAVYYLAPFEFDDEDPLTFTIEVKPADTNTTHSFTFQRTFYHDE